MQQLLKLLADPTRARILAAVDKEELAVNELADALGMGQSRISNHLRLLRDADALTARREGAWTFYRNALNRSPIWKAVREGMRDDAAWKADDARRRAVLERRRRRSREHFATAPGNGVSLENGSLREEILAASAPRDWVVVDAGCGDGFLTELLGERFDKVLAFDHSPERLSAARKRLKNNRVELDKGEVDDLPLETSSVDALFLSMVLHHVPEVAAALTEARRVLRPGGQVVIADLAPHDIETMRDEMGDLRLGLDPDDLERELTEASFTDIRTIPLRDRLIVGRHRPLEMILVTGSKPGRKRRRK